ncbi:MAG: formate dehydrogenase subunit alpha [Bacteroidetes bacterium GWF2_38_335]|nr:MAG: formate dehydrogenase subunit alpha [Bacteroidetes bacterium GWF2_38_335]OFY80943.1 MAG: formate dehydrogenase subunit alpha [Bacteroidetes bacterium RIFOXYA12_FULL_38_20]HBS85122.1 formate dehydrogenase subunit alpha [Bacteroidales bacterium]
MSKNISITIDGKKINTTEGKNLLQVALENKIEIPNLCFHRKLSPTGACRLCVTKIKNMRGFVTSCSTAVTDGMEVTAFDEELEQDRMHTMSLLLAEHNESYDHTYPDELKNLKEKYGLDKIKARKHKPLKTAINHKADNSSPVLTYDSSKCIKCFRCIKACEEVQGKSVLNFHERGLESYIIAGTGIWSNSECDGCGECVQLCPTGALVEKPHRNEINLDKIERKVKTTCPYCGVGCQIELFVQNGKIVRSNGIEGVSPNDGRLCVKGRFGYDFVGSNERLTTPLIKKKGKFVNATWDEALDLIAKKFNEIKEKYGNDSIAGYSSAKCTNEDNYIFQKMMRVAFGTNNMDYCTRLCHASTVTAMLRSIGDGAGSNSIEDFETTDCLFVTGNNIIETHPITATYVKRGAKKGMNIIVCDPRWTPLVKYAKIWLQPKLGTDVALLNGMMHIIIKEGWFNKEFIEKRIDRGMEAFEELRKLVKKYNPKMVEKITGVPAKKLYEASKMYALAPTAMIATGMGMSQQVTGTHNVFSLLNMCFITGQIGRERCGINPPRGQNNVQGATDVGVSPLNYPGYIPIGNEENRKKVAKIWKVPFEKLSGKAGLTTVEIMKAAHDGKIRGMFIMGENPMVTDPNLNHTIASVKKLEFLVVQDIFHTETTPYADVILPASSFAEKEGTFVNSDRRVLRVRKAVEMPGEAREDWKILLEISKRMGTEIGNYKNASEIFDEIAKVTPIMAGISYKRLEKGSIQWPCPDKNHPGTSTLFLEKFNTPNGKAKLNPVDYAEQSEKASPEYPYILNSGRILYQYHSSTMSRKNKSLTAFANKSYVLIHPVDAEKNKLKNGDRVKLTNIRGVLETTVEITDGVAIGELFMPWHYGESLVNSLTRDELDPFSKIAPFKLSAVSIKKAK